MAHILDQISDVIQKILQALLIIISILLLVVNLAQICGRNLFFYSLPWSEQLSTYLFIWSIFLGYHLVVKQDSELKIEAITFKDARKQAVLDSIRDIASLVMIIIFFVSSLEFLQGAIRNPQRSSSMPINMYVVYSIMPISFALFALQKVTNLIKRIGKIMPAKETEGES